jgi:alkanesulfonate monooxygenase SsuD/methylene tetrahydromethanopterin reductase-like flavin-dependent oxidoreductase (luciferase family)
MRFAVTVPNFGDYFDVRRLAALARDAEDAGWDGFFLWDHLLYGPVPVADPWVALTAVVLNTERLRLGTLVTPLPRRDLPKLARETVSLDHLSNGRLTLGVGIGTGPWEWAYLGHVADERVRGAMLDEGLDVLSQMWSGLPFSHSGKYYHVTGDLGGAEGQAQFLPAARQQPRIPIWVGGTWPRQAPFRRAARWDGAVPMFNGQMTSDVVREISAYIRQHRHSTAPFDLVVAGATSGDGSAKDAGMLHGYEDAGATWWLESIEPWRFGWNWQGAWPIEAMTARIRQGPPKI